MNEKTIEQIIFEQGKIVGRNEVLRALVTMIKVTDDPTEIEILFQTHQRLISTLLP